MLLLQYVRFLCDNLQQANQEMNIFRPRKHVREEGTNPLKNAAYVGALAHLEQQFNEGEYSAESFELGGLGTSVKVRDDGRAFTVVIRAWYDLWVPNNVVFEVVLPDGFPKAKPQVFCVQIDEEVRLDPRLLVKGDNDEMVPRIAEDGSVKANLFTSQYMGWLETYDLEVVVHSLRLLFRKSDAELSPSPIACLREHPHPLLIHSAVHEEQGPRKTMEDRVCVEDFREIGALGASLNGAVSVNVASNNGTDMQSSALSLTNLEALADVKSPSRLSSLSNVSAEMAELNLDESVRLDDSFSSSFRSTSAPPFAAGEKGVARPSRRVSLHAVLDGHGGEQSAELGSELFENFFFEELENASLGIERALYNAVTRLEAEILSQAEKEQETIGRMINTSGTTLCAVAVDLDQGIAYCANVGDSRAVLCRGASAVELSTDHKATLPQEIANVVHSGGFVSYGRVLGLLALSRAIGDCEMKTPNQLISAIPTMTRVDLESADDFIAIACDGVFDVMSSQEVCDYVNEDLQLRGGDLEQVAIDLVFHCLDDLGSQDNVSFVLLKFHHVNHRDREFDFDKPLLPKVEEEEGDSYTTGEDFHPSSFKDFVDDMSNLSSSMNGSSPTTEGSTMGSTLSPHVKAAVRASRLRKHGSSCK